MRTAKELREIARDALSGKWKIAVIVGIVASMLGAVDGGAPDVNVNFDAENANASLEVAGQTVFHFHMHLIPRYNGDGQTISWVPDTSEVSERDAIADQIRTLMN